MSAYMNIEAFPCYTDYLNIVREFEYGTKATPRFLENSQLPPFWGKWGKNVMGEWGGSQGICLHISIHIKAYLVTN